MPTKAPGSGVPFFSFRLKTEPDERRFRRSRAGPRRDHHLRALSAPAFIAARRSVVRSGARIATRHLLGTARSRFWRSRRSSAACGARAGRARREPHGPGVHRRRARRIGRLLDVGAPPRRLRQHSDLPDAHDGLSTTRRLHRGRGSLRAARQQTDPGRDRQLPAAPRRRSRRASPSPRRRRARQDRVRRVSADARASRRVIRSAPALRSRFRADLCRTGWRSSVATTPAGRTRTPTGSRRG